MALFLHQLLAQKDEELTRKDAEVALRDEKRLRCGPMSSSGL
jgi:hypothetical protein